MKSFRKRQNAARSSIRSRGRGHFETLEVRSLLAADLVITEFMANNSQTLADEDGDYPDWIEIRNQGTSDAQLSEYHLTDDANDLEKWTFPNRTLPAGSFLVVYASGKDRVQPGSPLHTNFSLDDRGEYLALTHDAPLPGNSDNVSAVTEFAPQFPEQLKDVSYGIGQNVTINSVLPAGSNSRVMFPADGTLGTSWTGTSFVDNAWRQSTSAIGYVSSVPGFTVLDAHSSSQISTLAQADAVLDGTGQISQATVISPTVNFWDAGSGGGTGNFGNPDPFPNDSPGDDDDFAIRATGTIMIPSAGTWTFGTNSDDGARVRIDGANVINDDSLHGPDNRFGQVNLSAGPHELELVFFERGGGAEVELFAAKGAYS
ncbi:MAG: lamin tail domain-containing protein, partial [Planctomycetales bacterium]|nr:lamin tail domain-containing protein [Planctomycetales bacterium]